jgi:hypothetical protein
VDDGANLEERIVTVFDGGSCYFSVKYDPTRTTPVQIPEHFEEAAKCER